MNSAPAHTRHSLLASATTAPRSSAANVGLRPAAPVMAAITQSAGQFAASMTAPSPAAAAMPEPGQALLQLGIAGRVGDRRKARALILRASAAKAPALREATTASTR